jgi:serine/threonine protein kinase
VEHRLGAASGAEVWLARVAAGPAAEAASDPDGEPYVVLKRPSSDGGRAAVAALRGEAMVLRSVRHPHVLPVLDVLEPPDPRTGPTLVLPFLAGGTLRALLDERGVLTPGQVVAVLSPVADAVAALHRAGFAHGDLKPDNLLLDHDGAPVVGDAGTACPLGAQLPPDRPATPEYLDPADRSTAAGTADVYALGVVAYEAVCGRLPHRGEPAEVLAAAAAGDHRDLATWPGIPTAFARVVEAAIHPDPTRRPAGPRALAAALAGALDPTEPIALPGPCTRQAIRPEALRDGHPTLRFGPEPGRPSPPPTARGRARSWPRWRGRRAEGGPEATRR